MSKARVTRPDDSADALRRERYAEAVRTWHDSDGGPEAIANAVASGLPLLDADIAAQRRLWSERQAAGAEPPSPAEALTRALESGRRLYGAVQHAGDVSGMLAAHLAALSALERATARSDAPDPSRELTVGLTGVEALERAMGAAASSGLDGHGPLADALARAFGVTPGHGG